jgi:hypothetical protein
VTRRINDDVLPFPGLKPDLGRIDGDVLVSFGLQGIHQVGPFERNPASLGDCLELLELALGQRSGVMKQSSNEGRLAMIHMTDDDDLQLLARNVVWNRDQQWLAMVNLDTRLFPMRITFGGRR